MGQFFLFPPLCPIKALKSYSEFGGDSGLCAAEKFSNAALAPHLTKAIGSQSKLFELLVLDADKVQKLAAGGEVRGLDMDGIAGATLHACRPQIHKSGAGARFESY